MRTALPFLILAATISCGTKSKGSDPVVAAPISQANPAAPAQGGIVGTVQERLDASPYCYLRLKTAGEEVWVAVPEAKIEKGTEVNVANPMLMENFESKTLKRTFPKVFFGTLAPKGSAPAAAAAPTSMPAGPAGTPAPVPLEVGKIDKAPGADSHSIADLWAKKDGLKEKTVTVRGKVVKYNAGVMGKNWIHIQDGSGDQAKGTHDITITSQDAVSKGDVVTAKGVVRVGKDFGAGYKYEVIIEEAKVVKK